MLQPKIVNETQMKEGDNSIKEQLGGDGRKDRLKERAMMKDDIKDQAMKSINLHHLDRSINTLGSYNEIKKITKNLVKNLKKIYDYKLQWLTKKENADILKQEILTHKGESRGIEPEDFEPTYYHSHFVTRAEALEAFDQAPKNIDDLLKTRSLPETAKDVLINKTKPFFDNTLKEIRISALGQIEQIERPWGNKPATYALEILDTNSPESPKNAFQDSIANNTESLDTRKRVVSKEIDKINKNISSEKRQKTEEIERVYSQLISHGSAYGSENRATLDKITKLSQEYEDFQSKIVNTEKDNAAYAHDRLSKLIEIAKAAEDYHKQLKHFFNTEQQILDKKQKELLTLKSRKDSYIVSSKQLSTSIDEKTHQLDTLEISSILLRPFLVDPNSVSTSLSPEIILASQQQQNRAKEILEGERISLEEKKSKLQTELGLVRERIADSKKIIDNKTKIINQLKTQNEIPSSILNQVCKTANQISQDYPQIREMYTQQIQEVYAQQDNIPILENDYNIKKLTKVIEYAAARKINIQNKLENEGFKDVQVTDIQMINVLQNTKNTATIVYIYKNYLCSRDRSDSIFITSKLSHTENKLRDLVDIIKASHIRKQPIKNLNKELNKEFTKKGLNNTDIVKCLRLCKQQKGNGDDFPVNQLFKYWKREKSPNAELTVPKNSEDNISRQESSRTTVVHKKIRHQNTSFGSVDDTNTPMNRRSERIAALEAKQKVQEDLSESDNYEESSPSSTSEFNLPDKDYSPSKSDSQEEQTSGSEEENALFKVKHKMKNRSIIGEN